jgi:hypothetical protein
LEIINMNIKFKNLKRSRKLMEVNENLTWNPKWQLMDIVS